MECSILSLPIVLQPDRGLYPEHETEKETASHFHCSLALHHASNTTLPYNSLVVPCKCEWHSGTTRLAVSEYGVISLCHMSSGWPECWLSRGIVGTSNMAIAPLHFGSSPPPLVVLPKGASPKQLVSDEYSNSITWSPL